MEFLAQIDWRTVLITLAAAFIIYNTYHIIRYAIIKKKAEEQIKKIDAKIASINKELAATKKVMEDRIKKLSK